MNFSYSVLRVVPDLTREEFANVGIIVGTDEQPRLWKVVFDQEMELHPLLAGREWNTSEITNKISFLEKSVLANCLYVSDLANLSAKCNGYSFRVSTPKTLVCESVDVAARDLFAAFVKRTSREKIQSCVY